MFTKIDVKVESIVLNQGLSLVDAVASLRGLVETLTLQRNHRHRRRQVGRHGVEFLMTLATVGGFVDVSLDKAFIMPGDKGEPVDWPIVPRLIDLIVEYRVLRYLQRPQPSQGGC